MKILVLHYDNFFDEIIKKLNSKSKHKFIDFKNKFIEPADIDRQKKSFSNKDFIFNENKIWEDSSSFYNKYFISFLDIYNQNYKVNDFVSKKWGNNNDYYMSKNFFMYLVNLIHNFVSSNKFKFVIFVRYPHTGIDYILYKYCEFNKIKKVFFHQSHIPNKFIASNNLENYGNFRLRKKIKLNFKEKSLFEYKKPFWLKKNHFFNEKIKRLKSHKTNYLLSRSYAEIKNFFSAEYLLKNLIVMKKNLAFNLEGKKMNKFSKNNKKFGLYLLHFQPEGTSSFFGNLYIDQILAIEKLLKKLPKNYHLIVKEHPRQHFLTRDKYFFKRLKALKQVSYLISDTTSTKELIKNSKFVSTITGTGAWEALTLKKPVILFGKTWFSKCPGVFDYSDDININQIMDFKFSEKKMNNFRELFFSNAYNGVVAPEWDNLVENFSKTKNTEVVTNSVLRLIKNVKL